MDNSSISEKSTHLFLALGPDVSLPLQKVTSLLKSNMHNLFKAGQLRSNYRFQHNHISHTQKNGLGL